MLVERDLLLRLSGRFVDDSHAGEDQQFRMTARAILLVVGILQAAGLAVHGGLRERLFRRGRRSMVAGRRVPYHPPPTSYVLNLHEAVISLRTRKIPFRSFVPASRHRPSGRAAGSDDTWGLQSLPEGPAKSPDTCPDR